MINPPFPLTQFDHPLVRDLCWTLDPAFDLLGQLPPHQRFVLPQAPDVLISWLWDLQRDPRPLQDFMSRSSVPRLGHHFESLVLFYLHHGPANPFQVLDHHRPIIRQSPAGHPITIGEIDFLLESPTARAHLEIAVKFYLGVETAGEIHWIGPGLRDRLDRKLQHLRQHQLPVSRALDLEPLERYFWVKGVLFHPWSQPLQLPEGLIAPEQVSFWLTCSQAIDTWPSFSDWCCLKKPHWLGCAWNHQAAPAVIPAATPTTPVQIREHFASSKQALMLWSETRRTRCLIVADDWPTAARAAAMQD